MVKDEPLSGRFVLPLATSLVKTALHLHQGPQVPAQFGGGDSGYLMFDLTAILFGKWLILPLGRQGIGLHVGRDFIGPSVPQVQIIDPVVAQLCIESGQDTWFQQLQLLHPDRVVDAHLEGRAAQAYRPGAGRNLWSDSLFP